MRGRRPAIPVWISSAVVLRESLLLPTVGLATGPAEKGAFMSNLLHRLPTATWLLVAGMTCATLAPGAGCSSEHSQQCNDRQLQCGDGTCITSSNVCDGIQDCGDGADEQGCGCGAGDFLCTNGACIPQSQRCDNVAQCADGSDEASTLCTMPENCTNGVDDDGDSDADCNDSDCEDHPSCLAWPATPQGYNFGPSTYIASLLIPPLQDMGGVNVATCCRDFGAISKDNVDNGTTYVDNAYAALHHGFAGIPSLGIDLQASLNAAIQDGTMVMLLDHPRLNNDTDTFVLAQFLGQFSGATDYAAAAAGTGNFSVDPAGFVGTSGEPAFKFDPAMLNLGAMSGANGGLLLPLRLPGLTVMLPLMDARISGQATVGPNGVSYAGGTVDGYFKTADLFASLNAHVTSSQCACLGITTPVFTQDLSGNWQSTCLDSAATTCGPQEATCTALADDSLTSLCSLLPGVFARGSDLDLDGDTSVYEGFSVGLEWTGAEASLVGLLP